MQPDDWLPESVNQELLASKASASAEIAKRRESYRKLYTTKFLPQEVNFIRRQRVQALLRIRDHVGGMRKRGTTATEIREFEADFLGELMLNILRDQIPPVDSIYQVARLGLGYRGKDDAVGHKIERRLKDAIKRWAPAHVADLKLVPSKNEFLDVERKAAKCSDERGNPEAEAPSNDQLEPKEALRLLMKELSLSPNQLFREMKELLKTKESRRPPRAGRPPGAAPLLMTLLPAVPRPGD